MKKYLLIILFSIIAQLGYSQCAGSFAGVVSPTVAYQTFPVAGGIVSYRSFDAVAGATYNFTYCSNGGSSGGDPYLSITNEVPAGFLAQQDDFCGLSSNLFWVCPASGVYRIYMSGCCPCNPAPGGTLAYNVTGAANCISGGGQFPGTFASPTFNTPYTITGCNFQQEYNQMTGVTANSIYTSTASIGGTYITVRFGAFNGPLVAAGTAPLTWMATSGGGTYFIHYNTNSACGNAASCMTTTVTCNTCPAPIPDINVQGNGINIPDGNVGTVVADNTLFNTVPACAGTGDEIFTIQNTGTGNLNITGAITSTNGLFTVVAAPGTPIAPGGSTTFTLRYSPTNCSVQTSTITIPSDDPDAENPYTFNVSAQRPNASPTFTTCSGNLSLAVVAGTCGRTVNYALPVGADDCAGFSVAQTDVSGFTRGDFFPVGVTTQTWTNTDACGATTNCSFTITIVDNINPTITCPANQTLNLTAACNAVLPSYSPLAASDNCPGVVVTQSPVAGTVVVGTGVTVVTLTATDASARTSTCNFNVTRVDVTPPVLTCPGTQTLNLGALCTAVLPNYTGGVAVDACGGIVTVTQSPAIGSAVAGIGTTAVTLTATDPSGNSTSCVFNVNRVDVTAPTITCPAAQNLNLDASCNGVMPNYTGLATTGAANCGPTTVTQSPIAGTAVSGAGITVVTLTATDGSGNVATCTFNVNRLDITAPVVTCPANISVPASAGVCNAVVAYSNPTLTDNCAVVPGSQTFNFTGGVQTFTVPAGVTSITVKAWGGGGGGGGIDGAIGGPGGGGAYATSTLVVVPGTNLSVYVGGNGTAGFGCNTASGAGTGGFGYGNGGNGGNAGPSGCSGGGAGGGGGSAILNGIVPLIVASGGGGGGGGGNDVPSGWGGGGGQNGFNSNVVGGTAGGSGSINGSNGANQGGDGGAGGGGGGGLNGGTSGTTPGCDCSGAGGAGGNSFATTVINGVSSIPGNSGDPVLGATLARGGNSSMQNGQPGLISITWIGSLSVSQTLGLASGATFPVGTTTNTFSANDGNGNTSTCSFTVTVNDAQAPTFTSCPANIATTTLAACNRSVVNPNPVTADNCGVTKLIWSTTGATVISSPLVGINNIGTQTFNTGVTTVTYTAFDAAGNTVTCVYTVTVTDATAPTIVCPANISTPAAFSQCSQTVVTPNPTPADNCGVTSLSWVLTGATVGSSPLVGINNLGTFTFNVGVTTVTYTAKDAAGNTITCFYTVTITDTQLPTITCPANIVVNAGAACNAVVTYTAPVGIDNCAGATTALFAGLASGSTFPIGVNTVTYRVTDAVGNIANCSFTVTVIDATAPVITCPGTQTLNLGAACTAVLPNYTAGTATDNCTAAGAIVYTQLPAAGSTVSGVGTTAVTITATDGAGNTSSCVFNVNRVDVTAPVITCPAAQTVALNGTCTAALPSYTSGFATVTDNCGASFTVTQSPIAGTALVGTGVTAVTLTVTDASGNTANCSFNVTRVDLTPPVITCPGTQTVPLTAACNITLPDLRALATKSDNCTAVGAIVMTQVPAIGTVIAGTGTTVVTLTATDASGNASSCSFNVSRIDVTPPTITCPAAQNLNLGVGCNATLPNYTALAVKSDNCTAAGSIIVSQSPAPGSSVSGVGVTVITLTAIDLSGNVATCTFNVNKLDVTVPTITCPATQTLALNGGCAGVLPSYTALATTTDNCGAVVVTQSPVAGTAVSGTGTTVITLTGTDASGNIATCTFNVNRIDNTAPVITCPANIVVPNTLNVCGAIVSFLNPTATDNCNTAVPFSFTYPGPSIFLADAPATTTSTLAVAGLNNNLGTNVSLNSVCINLTHTWDSDLTLNLTSPTGTVFLLSSGNGGSGDNYQTTCFSMAAGTSITAGAAPFNGSFIPQGAGGFASYNGQNPNGNWVLSSTDGAGGDTGFLLNWTLNFSNLSGATVTQTAGLASGATFPIGTTTNTFVATDGSGNTSNCSFTVTVNDTQAPAITCPATQNLDLDAACAAVLPNYTLLATATDNCGPVTVTQSPLPGTTVSGAGALTVTLTATAPGGTTNCTFTVNKNDITAPVITCPTNIIANSAVATCSAVVSFTNPTATDNCAAGGGGPVAINYAGGPIFLPDLATTTSTMAAGGLNNTLGTNVTLSSVCINLTHTWDSDLTLSLTSPTGTVFLLSAGNGGSGDNYQTTCFNMAAGTSITAGAAPFNGSFIPQGAGGFAVFNGQNPNGNWTLTSTDGAGGDVGTLFAWSLNFINGASGPTITQTAGLASGSSFPVGTTVNTFTATDAGGNVSSCSFNVTVNDIVAPTIACPAAITVNNDPGICGAAVSYTAPVGADNCALAPTIVIYNVPFSQLNGLTNSCGTNSYYNDCVGGAAGFHWTSTGTGAPTNIQVQFTVGVECGAGSYTPNLNGNAKVPFASTPGNCSCNGQAGAASDLTFNITPAGYVVGGTNTLLMSGMPSCWGLFSNGGLGAGIYARVTVTYPGAPILTAGLASGAMFPLGTTTNTYTVTDLSGNVNSCSFNVTVNDAEAPVFTACPINVVTTNDPSVCGAVVNYTTPICAGGSGIFFNEPDLTGFDNAYTVNGPFTIADDFIVPNGSCWNINSFSAEFWTLTGNQLNSVTVSILADAAGAPGAVLSTQTIGGANWTSSIIGTAFGAYDIRRYDFTLPVSTNVCGGPGGTRYWLQVHENVTNPVYWSITNVINNNAFQNGAGIGFDVVFTIGGGVPGAVTDNCTTCPALTVVQTSGLPTGSTFPVGTTTNTFVATDASGNASTCTFTVNVSDTEFPVIGPIGPITAFNTPGMCGRSINYVLPYTDNCPGVVVTQTDGTGYTSGNFFPIGTTVQSYTVTDAAGHAVSVSFNVIITDNELPIITSCPSNIVLSNTPGTCGATANWVAPTASDNCPGVTLTSNFPPGFIFPAGVTTPVVYTATDVHGNSSICNFNVTVNDVEIPVIACPATQTLNLDATCSAVLPDYTGLAVASDNCSFVVTQFPIAGTPVSGVGTTVVTLTVTDVSLNTASCNFNVSRVDLIAPVAICQPVTVFLDAFGNATTTAAAVNNLSTDNCSIASMSLDITSFNCSNVGTPVAVVLTVTDGSGNTNTCSTFVTVLDNSTPVITCPAAQTLNLDATCSGLLPDYTSLATVTDNCSTTITQSPVAGTAVSGVGTTVITLTVTDGTNTTNCSFNVNRVDAIAPSITCPGTQTINLDAACAGTLPDYTGAVTSDNCSAVIVTQSPAIGSPLAGVGSTIVTLTATDASLNVTNCTFTVNTVDIIAPSITCPATQTLALDATCSALLPDYTGMAIASDNCGVTVTQSPAIGSTVSGVGTTVITLTATDGSGNATSCTFNVNRVDLIAPIPTIAALPVVNGICSITPPTPTASDNCSGLLNGVSNVAFPITSGGLTVVTWTYTDASGNFVTQTQNVVNATPEADITGNGNPIVDHSSAYSLTNFTDFGSVGVCATTMSRTYTITNNGIGNLNLNGTPIVMITGVNAADFTVTAMPASPVGQGLSTTFTVTFNPSASGNRYARITVINDDCDEGDYYFLVTGFGSGSDVTPPVADVPLLPNINGACSATVSTFPTATDACTGVVTGTTTSPLTYTNQGTYTVIWTYTDGNGNSSTQTQTVVVNDLTPPTALCQPAVIELDNTGNGVLLASAINNGSFDNCGPLTFIGIVAAVKVTNGAFTSNITGWTAANGASYNATLGNPAGCAWLNGTGSPATDPYVKQTFSDLVPGATYVIRGNFRGTSIFLGVAGQQALAVDIDGTQIATRPLGTPVTSFQPINVTFTATSSSHTVGFRGEINGTDVDVVIDNISIDGTAKKYNCFTRGNFPVVLVVADSHGNTANCATNVTVQATINPCPFTLPIDESGVVVIENQNRDESGNTSIENENVFDGRIYPNPSNGIFTLELSDMPRGNAQLRVVDALGQVIYTTSIMAQTMSFDLNYLRAATYYVQVISNEGNFTKTIVVTHSY